MEKHPLSGYPLDHIGIAVTDLDTEIQRYQRDFGYELGLRETLKEQHVNIAFLNLPNTRLELLSPLGETGSLYKFLNTRGPGLHHLCFEVEDIKLELNRLEALGHKLIDQQARPGAHNTKIAFLHPKSTGGTLIELCQYSQPSRPD